MVGDSMPGIASLPGVESAAVDMTIPRLHVLRRVPRRYRKILPLAIMKRYRCIVVGADHGVLTIAITDRRSIQCFRSLSRLTGCALFPVLVHPTRMRILLQRLEREERGHFTTLNMLSPFHPIQVRPLLGFLST